MEENPHLTIAKFVDDAFAFYSWWYKPRWDGLDVHGHSGQDFTQYQEFMRTRAVNGGLLEVSAICSAFRLQALVYDAANERFIRMGKAGRR
eukprot:3896072-Prorocentrum_lima.AAC.1